MKKQRGRWILKSAAARKKGREATRAWQAADPRRAHCHREVKKAIREGRLERPDDCSVCGPTDYQIDAHHEDYDKPLEIMWLCRRCHTRLHLSKRAT